MEKIINNQIAGVKRSNSVAFISNSSSISNSRLSLNSQSGLPLLRTYLNGPGVGKYGRKSSIGLDSNDLTLSKSPAFSIGKAARFEEFNNLSHRSPGPIYCPIIIKKRSPSIIICSRYREFTSCITPGPGAYAPEKHYNPFKKSIPAFSIGKASRWPTIKI